MQFPANLKYTDQHEWILVDGAVATVGITDFAQQSLGDVVFIQMPEEGAETAVGDAVAEVESVKAVSDVYSPLTGTIVAINEALDGNEELVNQDPYGEGWLFKVEFAKPEELDGLMDVSAYQAFVAEQGH